jgi:hypothetical protein
MHDGNVEVGRELVQEQPRDRRYAGSTVWFPFA